MSVGEVQKQTTPKSTRMLEMLAFKRWQLQEFLSLLLVEMLVPVNKVCLAARNLLLSGQHLVLMLPLLEVLI